MDSFLSPDVVVITLPSKLAPTTEEFNKSWENDIRKDNKSFIKKITKNIEKKDFLKKYSYIYVASTRTETTPSLYELFRQLYYIRYHKIEIEVEFGYPRKNLQVFYETEFVDYLYEKFHDET